MRNRRRARFAVTGVTAILAITSLGCGFVRDLVPDRGSSGPGAAPAPQTTPAGPPTFNPDAMGEVVGTNCRYDQSAQQFKFDVSVQNSSTTHAFRYSITIRFAGGDSPFSDDSFGSQMLDVTVAPGRDRKLTVSQGYTMTKRTYYGCHITSATKGLAN